MRRLVVQCSCGERIQVPHSALGKAGLCPSCGASIFISKDNAAPYRGTAASTSRTGAPQAERPWTGGAAASDAPEDVRRRFAEGVDLYFAKRYSEALVIFNTLAAAMPHDADIQMGQTMCINALRKVAPFGLGHGSPFGLLPGGEGPEDRIEKILHGPTPTLDRDFFRRFLFDKMLHGQGDDVQMRAAELAAKMFGVVDDSELGPAAAETMEQQDEPEDDAPTAYDLPRPTPFRRVSPDDIDR